MMPTLSIPLRHHAGISAIRKLSDVQFRAFIAALENAPITADTGDLTKAIQGSVPESFRDSLNTTIETILSMYVVKSRVDVSPENFVADLQNALNESGSKDSIVAAQEAQDFAERFIKILQVARLNIIAKAVALRTDFPNVLTGAKLITDIRPIFGDLGEPPSSSIVTFTLKIEYYNEAHSKSIYFALDSRDVAKLREALDRAHSKAESLSRLLVKADIPQFEEL